MTTDSESNGADHAARRDTSGDTGRGNAAGGPVGTREAAPAGARPPHTTSAPARRESFGVRLWQGMTRSLSFWGFVGALVLFWLSSSPSLLPRSPLFQGVVAGASAAVGYLLGVFAAWLVRFLMSRDTPWRAPARVWWVLLALVAIGGTASMIHAYSGWQKELRTLMGVELLPANSNLTIVAVALLVFVLLLVIGRAWAALIRGASRGLKRVAPPRVSAAVAGIVVVLLTIGVLNGVVAARTMELLNTSFRAVNDETTADSAPPTSRLRSGGPESAVSWDSLGKQGRIFVSNGPTVEQLSEFNGAPAIEPVRAYAGLGSGEDLRANAELAARELERAGGLERSVVAIGSTTGTGWINRATVDSLEYMYNGDVATVSMQYSYLPSWLSFLVDKERARQAGRALFEAVDERVRAIPEAERPTLVVFGESLGSFGGESAFGTIPDIAARTDGALFVGPTFNNALWRETTQNRDAGSPERLPIFAQGRQVRFVADAADLDRPDSPWGDSRVVYVQHASDPIAWWSPDLILEKPAWLDESRGPDVLDATRWIPFVTFLQVSADMATSTGVPDGHGHNYLAIIPRAWATILRPPGWTDADTRRLEPLLRRD